MKSETLTRILYNTPNEVNRKVKQYANDLLFNNFLHSNTQRSYNQLYRYISQVSDQIIRKQRIIKSEEFKEELKSKIQLHVFTKLDRIRSAKYPKTYLSSLIHNQIRNAMRNESRYVERTNQAVHEFKCQHYEKEDFISERHGFN
jgi:DNA-directed RNA polymerase specialized sigma24 family protein